MKNLIFRKCNVIILILIIFSGCNQIKLTNEEAQKLIIKELSLPQKFAKNVSANWSSDADKLVKEGFMYRKEVGFIVLHYRGYITEKGKPFYLGKNGKDNELEDVFNFKTFDADFDAITGIAINKDDQTATVRFTLKPINVTPIGTLIEENINNTRNGELVFKKFDNGWQLAKDQNKGGTELVKEIWWGKNREN